MYETKFRSFNEENESLMWIANDIVKKQRVQGLGYRIEQNNAYKKHDDRGFPYLRRFLAFHL